MSQDRLIQIASNVWVWPHNPDPKLVQAAIGVVVGNQETILIDAGNSPLLGKRILETLRSIGAPEVSQVIYTHHHWDHVFGASAFGAPAIAHERCRSYLLEKSTKPWGETFLKDEVERNPKLEVRCRAMERAIESWDDFRIVVPEEVFQTTHMIKADGITIELEHVGGEHASDSTVVRIPEEGVVFLGDCYYPPPFHLRGETSTFAVSMLESLIDPDYQTYVDGHSGVYTVTELTNFARRLRYEG